MFVGKSKLFTALLLLLLCVSASLHAQGTAATVSGVVTDSSGAQLPGATVTFTNIGTNLVSTATANSAGVYRISGLLPGAYRASVTMTGFKTVAREGIELHTEDNVTLNYGLDIGAASEVVNVDASSQVLETTSPTASQVIEGRQVEDLATERS